MENKKAVLLEFINRQEQNYQLKDALTVIFCLTGKITVETITDRFDIQAEGVVAVNPLQPYRSICGIGSYAICLQIGAKILKKADWGSKDAVSCHIPDATDQAEQ